MARRRNIEGAFHALPVVRRMTTGCDLLLIDDVMTTGATATEAANALLDSGAARVDCAVLLDAGGRRATP